MTATFDDFPNETICQIVDNLAGDRKSLRALNLTCRRLSAHSTHCLWRTFEISLLVGNDIDFRGAAKRVRRLCRAPHLCKLIRVLRECEYHPDEAAQFQAEDEAYDNIY